MESISINMNVSKGLLLLSLYCSNPKVLASSCILKSSNRLPFINLYLSLELLIEIASFMNEAGFPESLNALIKIYYGLDDQEDESNIESALSNLSTDVKGNQFQEDLSVILYNNLFEDDEENIDDE